MLMKRLYGAMLAATLFCTGVAQTRADFMLESGNGAIGGKDSLVHVLIGPSSGVFSSPFTAADFDNARNGPLADIIFPHSAWISALSSNANAQWISTNPNGASDGSTALYAIDFVLTDPVATASLDLNFAVDNHFGGGPNQGVFLNGVAISGDSTIGNYSSEFSIHRDDIGPLLTIGTNTLYINATNEGGPAGLLFSATITTTPITTTPVPEPGTLSLLGIGIVSLLGYGWHRRPGRGRGKP